MSTNRLWEVMLKETKVIEEIDETTIIRYSL